MKPGSSVPGNKGKHFHHSDALKIHDVIRSRHKKCFSAEKSLCGKPVEQGQLDQLKI